MDQARLPGSTNSLPVGIEAWLAEWELELSAGRPGDETIKIYLRSVRQFLTWLAEHHPGVTEPALISWPHVRGWTQHLIDLGRAEATRRVRGIALRKWLQYVADEPDSGLDHNPADRIELPMPKDVPVPVISDEDLSVLLKSMAGHTFADRRDTVIVRLLLDAGPRRAELVGIDVSDVDLQAKDVRVHGKGSKDRILPFGNKTALAIRKYLRVRATHPAADSPALFLSVRMGGRGGYRLAGGSVGEMLERRCQAAGLGRVWAHMFRHTWAHALKRAGMPDSDLERLAGWSTPMMSRRYGNSVADERARETSRRFGLGDRV
jgi:site-specific recombinase XerD